MLKSGVDLYETCFLFTFLNTCTYTNIHTEKGTAVIQSPYSVILLFPPPSVKATISLLWDNCLPPVSQRREDPMEMAAPVCTDSSWWLPQQECGRTSHWGHLRDLPQDQSFQALRLWAPLKTALQSTEGPIHLCVPRWVTGTFKVPAAALV